MTIEHVETVAFLTLFEFRVASARFLLGRTVVLPARSNQLFQRIGEKEIVDHDRTWKRVKTDRPQGLIASVADWLFEEEGTNDNNTRSNDSSKGTRQTS